MQEHYINSDLNIQLGQLLQQLDITKIFLVRGEKSYSSCGASDVINPILCKNGIQPIHFSAFSVNPKIEDVNKGVAFYKERYADAILAVGGGSTLDMAKLIRYHVFKETGKRIPLIAIPTTAGSGAEATHFSVCYINEEKHSISDVTILPDYVFIYPKFTYDNDAYLTACTGFDAIAQAIESFWSVKSTDESRTCSIRALRLLWEQLPELVRNPSNTQLRAQVAEGAYHAGCAINMTTTTAPHAFSYKFTSLYGYAHGHAVALTFPFFFALNIAGNGLHPEMKKDRFMKEMDSLMDVLGCKDLKGNSRQEYMEDYISFLGLSGRRFTTDEIDSVVNSFNRQRASNNPVVIDEKITEELKSYLYRKGQ